MVEEEIEVKFYVSDLERLEARLRSLAARPTQSRLLEQNLRFDTPDRRLTSTSQVLRLRRDSQAHLTYKGPAEILDGTRVRQEIEFILDDFQAAWHLLLALGFEVSMQYDKYRSVYDLQGVHISLDELPYGDFVEIEGPDPASIRTIAAMLGLDWEARVPVSYTVLFEQIQARLRLNFRDLVFENFGEIQVTAADLQVIPADL